MKTSHFLDFRRAFRRRWAVGWSCRIADFVGQPVFVAVVVGLAFLAKDVKSLVAFSHAFFYFTGLYAFWVGMFGSCQSLNGEVQNGEWSYWTLGLRRNIPRHVCSVFAVNVVCAFWNVALFLAITVAVGGILARTRGFNPFVAMFLTLGDSDAFWQAGYMLKPLLVSEFGLFGPILFSTAIFGISLFSAALCGVCFGMLFSAVFKDPAVSLNGTVGFVVLLGMLSLLGLQGDKSRSDKAPNLSREFLPRIEARHLKPGMGKAKEPALRFLVDVSRYLPQRYFFNIARMPMQKNVDDFVYESLKTGLEQRIDHDFAKKAVLGLRSELSPLEDRNLRPCALEAIRRDLDVLENPDEFVGWWQATRQPKNNCALSFWQFCSGGESPAVENVPAERMTEFLAGRIADSPGFADRFRFDLYARTLIRAIAEEMLPLFLMCLVCLSIVHVCVLMLPAYRQLR